MMRILLLAGTALAAFASPAVAQASPSGGGAPARGATGSGDPVLDRLNALDARVRELEARNAELAKQARPGVAPSAFAEVRSSKNVEFGWAPTFADPGGDFTFRPRGWMDIDAAIFNERRGDYDYNDGTALRRLRLGFEEADFAGDAANITDAYLQYVRIPDLVLTVGQHKAPFGLEANNTDHYNVFLERGMFQNAFNSVGADRRIGISAAWSPARNINVAGGFFGDNESISRSTISPVTNTPDESWGFNGRATLEPVFEARRIVHLGVSGFYRTSLKSGDTPDAIRIGDRPDVRVDNGNIADSGLITNVRFVTYAGAEAVIIRGPLTLAGEAGRLWANRDAGFKDAHFTGFYAYASYFLTGETRPMKNGNYDRVRPQRDFGKGGLGALEIAARFDRLNLEDTPNPSRLGNDVPQSFRQTSVQLGVVQGRQHAARPHWGGNARRCLRDPPPPRFLIGK